MGENFFTSSDLYTDGLAEDYGLKWSRTRPAIAFISKNKEVESFNETIINVSEGGSSVDLKYDQIVLSSGINKTIAFNLQRGLEVSRLEGTVLEAFYENVTGISTTSILNKVTETNVSIFFISSDTMDRLGNVSIPQEDKDIITSLVNSTSDVFAIVPNGSIQIGNWTGIGYVIVDGKTGAGKYLISGGLAGGATDGIVGKAKGVGCGILTLIESDPATAIVPLLLLLGVACAGGVAFTGPVSFAFCAAVFTTGGLYAEYPPAKLAMDLAVGAIVVKIKDEVECPN
jgi:hypothetical protein